MKVNKQLRNARMQQDRRSLCVEEKNRETRKWQLRDGAGKMRGRIAETKKRIIKKRKKMLDGS